MKSKVLVCFALLFLGFIPGLSYSGVDEKNEKIRELIMVTGAMDIARQVNESMTKQLLEVYPVDAHPFIKRLSATMNSTEYEELIYILYEKNFTSLELDAMLKFYTSEEGKSIIEKMPAIVKESMEIGALYGRIQAEKIIQKMKKEGFEPKKI